MNSCVCFCRQSHESTGTSGRRFFSGLTLRTFSKTRPRCCGPSLTSSSLVATLLHGPVMSHGLRFSITTARKDVVACCLGRTSSTWWQTLPMRCRAIYRTLEIALAGCMERLKEVERDVMQRSYGTDATINEVAAELGRPVGTVKDILARARRTLYDCICRSLRKDRRS